MPELLEIRESDIYRLTDPALHDLGQRLVETELRSKSLPLLGLQTSAKTNLTDGGIDLWVQWPKGDVGSTEFIPSNPTGFQFKAGDDGPSKLAASLTRGGHFAESVRRLAEASGTYVLVTSKRLTTSMIESRRAVVVKLAKQHCDVELDVIVMGAERLASWCNSSLGAALQAARSLQVRVDAPIQTPTEVLRRTMFSNDFVETERVLAQIATVSKVFEALGTSLRLDGPSGVGKTRTALEATRRSGMLFSNCIFVDLSVPNSEAMLTTAIINWARENRSGLIIADECSYDAHLRLSALISGSRLNFVSIDHSMKGDPRTGGYLIFTPGDADLTRPILSTRFRGADLDKAVQLSGGWPSMAVLILQAGLEGDLTLLTPQEVVNRILWPRSNPEPLQRDALQGLALFSQVQYQSGGAAEVKFLLDFFAPDLGADKFHALVKQLAGRHVLIEAGDFVRLVPPPLALELAGEWFRSTTVLAHRTLVQKMPATMIEAFGSRFRDLRYLPEARIVAEELARGPFVDSGVALTAAGAGVLRALSSAAPEAVLEALSAALNGQSVAAIKRAVGARRDLVYLLEDLAQLPEHFPEASMLLARLAIAENELFSNNSTGILKGLFSPYFGTLAGPRLRFAVIDALLGFETSEYDEISVACLTNALDVGRLGVMTRVGTQSWSPTPLELREYVGGAIGKLSQIFDQKRSQDQIRESLASALRSLVAADFADLGINAMIHVAPHAGTWKNGLQAAIDAEKFEGRSTADVRSRLQDLIATLSPVTLEERIRTVVSDPPNDVIEQDGTLIDRQMGRVIKLADDVTAEQLAQVIAWVTTGPQARGHDFGRSLAARFPSQLPRLSVSALRDSAARNPTFLSGVLTGITLSAALETLRIVKEDVSLRSMFPWLASAARLVAEGSVMDDLIDLAKEPDIREADFEALAFGSVLDAVGLSQVCELSRVLRNRSPVGSAIAFEVLHMLKRERRSPEVRREMRSAIESILNNDVLLNPMWAYGLAVETKRLLDDNDADFLRAVLSWYFRAGARDLLSPDPAQIELIEEAFRRWPQEALQLFIKALEDTKEIGQYRLWAALTPFDPSRMENRLLLVGAGAESIVDAVSRAPRFFYKELLQRVPLFAGHDVEAPSELLVSLLRKFGPSDGASRALRINILSFGGLGSRVPYLERRRGMLGQLRRNLGANFFAVIDSSIKAVDQEIKAAKKRDEEHSHGIYTV